MKDHPSHQSQLSALKRVEGQIRGVIKMIDEGKYCIDVLNQIKAAKAALVRIDCKDKNVDAIDIKKKEIEKAEKIGRDYLKPSCDEEISEEEYPIVKD